MNGPAAAPIWSMLIESWGRVIYCLATLHSNCRQTTWHLPNYYSTAHRILGISFNWWFLSYHNSSLWMHGMPFWETYFGITIYFQTHFGCYFFASDYSIDAPSNGSRNFYLLEMREQVPYPFSSSNHFALLICHVRLRKVLSPRTSLWIWIVSMRQPRWLEARFQWLALKVVPVANARTC